MAFDPYETWLGIPADLRPPTYYDLLGLASHESDPVAIEQAAARRMERVLLHQVGPSSDQLQAVLAELAQARLILIDPEGRANYNAKLRARAASRPGPAVAQENVRTGEAAFAPHEPEIALPDVLSSLVVTEREGDAPPTLHSALEKRPSSWKKAVVVAAFLASHGLLFGTFYFYMFGFSNWNRQDPDTLETTEEPPAPSAFYRVVPKQDAQPAIVPHRRLDSDWQGIAQPADPRASTDSTKPTLSTRESPKKQPSAAQKKLDRARKNSGRGGAPMQFSAPPVQVKPAFFVPRGETTPTPEQTRRLSDHLVWCQERYREMLNIPDTFSLLKDPALVHRSRTTLAELKAAPEQGAPRVAGELLDATRFNRFDCPYIFVAVVMNSGDNFPAGGGRPFNGGFNAGGGIVVLSSFTLDKLPNFQSTLEHELGHAFGLPHIDVYGQNMQTSASIMSYNPAHHTRGMQPSSTPGVLEPEDVLGLSLNRRAFPTLAAKRAHNLAPGAARTKVVQMGPMTIDGQPAYQLGIATDSGQTFGTKVSKIVQNKILPSVGGTFDRNSMWQSGKSESGIAAVLVTFPGEITLAALGVHSQHTGAYNGADNVRVEAYKSDGFQPVADSPLQAVDAIVPILEQSTAKIWRLSFHAANNKEVTLRGLQFFTRHGEIFPPPVPADDDVGFFRR